jgi:hypothetical protein
MVTSYASGETGNGGDKRRLVPWSRAVLGEGKAEGEEESKPAREKEKGGGDLIPSSVGGRRRASLRHLATEARPRSCFPAPRRRQGQFAKSPLALEFFGNFKNNTQLRCFVNQTCSKKYEEGHGPSCKY